MTFVEICGIIGIPSIISFLFQLIFNKIAENKRAKKDENSTLRLGVQALLRDRLLDKYEYYMKRGWISVNDKENFENMYKRYHELGKNGVMDKCYTEIMALPTEKVVKQYKNKKEN